MEQFAFPSELSGEGLKRIRRKLKLTQADFASFAGVSVKTVERWETAGQPISGPIVVLVNLLEEYPQIPEDFSIPPKEYPMRLWYYFRERLCTLIDVDELHKKVKIRNYTQDDLLKAFGVNERPDFKTYEEFLESRCFPRSRDKMKIALEGLGLPFYDPLLIVEKTQGRMAEDDFWIRIER